MVFSCPKPGRYFGFRLAGAAHKEEPNQSGLGHCSGDRRSQCRRIRSLHAASRSHTKLPRGRGVVPPEPAEPRRVVVPPSAVIPHRDR